MFLETDFHERRYKKYYRSEPPLWVASVIYSSTVCMPQQPLQLQFVAPFIPKQQIKVCAELI